MRLGIDVGGTHTDAVAITSEGKGGIATSCKTPTNHENLLASITHALQTILHDIDPAKITHLTISTTLSTNAIVQGQREDVGLIVSSGPGVNPHNFMQCKHFHVIDGSIDHRGSETQALSSTQLKQAINACRKYGVDIFAAVSKFSTRNPCHEKGMQQAIIHSRTDEDSDQKDFITLGHQLGGALNFPRRIATAYFNGAVWRVYNDFADAMENALKAMQLSHVHVQILKADGGTLPLSQSRNLPVQSIFSGPAASVMGIIALTDITHDSIILDIGGTTTDIAIFADGAPLIEREGITIASHPTSVAALKVHSIGIGGDSAITVLDKTVRVGPNRLGPPAALGGTQATLSDALNVLGLTTIGSVKKSRAALESLGATNAIGTQLLASQAVAYAVQEIQTTAHNLLNEINAKPVYTIHELIENKHVIPKKLYVMGGPAKGLQTALAKQFQLATEVPVGFDVANAIGAALTRTTLGLELFADTQRHELFIPSLAFQKNIRNDYTQKDAEDDATTHLIMQLEHLGESLPREDVQITHSSCFNMIEGMQHVGKNIRVNCQIRPDVLTKIVHHGRESSIGTQRIRS